MNGSIEDYANVCRMFFELYAEYSIYKKPVDEDKNYYMQMFAKFINNNTLLYDDGLRIAAYDRSEVHRIKSGIDFAVLETSLKSFNNGVKVTTFSYNDPSYDHKFDQKTAKYDIKVSRNFVRDLHDLSANEVKKVFDQYFYPIARGHIKEKCN